MTFRSRTDLSEEMGILAYGIVHDYRPGHGTDPTNALIAATAMHQGLTLVTRNRKHFEANSGLEIEVPQYGI